MDEKYLDNTLATKEWLEGAFPGLKLAPWGLFQEWQGRGFTIKFYPAYSTISSFNDDEKWLQLRMITVSSVLCTVSGQLTRKGDIRTAVALFDQKFADSMI